jgi:hypothetical protein
VTRARYTAAHRREAIRVCAIAASDFVTLVGFNGAMSDTFGTCDGPGFDLARAALANVPFVPAADASAQERARVLVHSRELWAEAECLLRDGWSPGEPVERLGGAPVTKWEKIFKSWHPAASVESQGRGLGRYYRVLKKLGSRTWAGQGATRELAWADACSALRLDKVKAGAK